MTVLPNYQSSDLETSHNVLLVANNRTTAKFIAGNYPKFIETYLLFSESVLFNDNLYKK